MTRVSMLQIASSDTETQAQRVARVLDTVRAERDAELVLLPELWATGFFNFDRCRGGRAL